MAGISISQLDGFSVGHAEDRVAGTGCTAILTPGGAVASGFTPGFAPGSREMDLLRPENTVPAIHGLLLTGGSAFGLAAAGGVVRFLREAGAGFDTGLVRVPLVPAAVIFDYPGNRSDGRLPDEAMGYAAAWNATRDPVRSGPFGAGLSATSGKVAGLEYASPSGLGSYGIFESGVAMTALAVVNALGSIVDPDTGAVISGVRRPDGGLADRAEILDHLRRRSPAPVGGEAGHTVLVAVGTNARLDKLGAWRLARMAAVGIGRAVYPAHLTLDGDTIFAMSSNTGPEADLNWLGALAAEVVARAIVASAPGRGATA